MTFIPSDSHCGINFSKSNMFSLPRYNTGVKLFAFATALTADVGDGRDLPVANHVSVSVTQKSGSQCDAIAYLDVTTMLSWRENSWPDWVRYVITVSLSLMVSVLLVSGALLSDMLSKFTSENTGIDSVIVSASGSGASKDISKSDGNGIMSDVVSGAAFLVSAWSSDVSYCVSGIICNKSSFFSARMYTD